LLAGAGTRPSDHNVANTPKITERRTTIDIEKANMEATERMMEARPVLVGLGKARDVIPGMRDNPG
jgi:hypothetical protein